MPQSPELRREVAAMAKIERTLADLPDRARDRVVRWVVENYADPAPAAPGPSSNGEATGQPVIRAGKEPAA